MARKDVRRELLDQLASAPDDVVVKHAQIIKDLLDCPTWCCREHTEQAADWHSSRDVENEVIQGDALTAALTKSEGGPAFVRLDDGYMTAAQARAFAADLVRLADTIDPGPAPLKVAQ